MENNYKDKGCSVQLPLDLEGKQDAVQSSSIINLDIIRQDKILKATRSKKEQALTALLKEAQSLTW